MGLVQLTSGLLLFGQERVPQVPLHVGQLQLVTSSYNYAKVPELILLEGVRLCTV